MHTREKSGLGAFPTISPHPFHPGLISAGYDRINPAIANSPQINERRIYDLKKYALLAGGILITLLATGIFATSGVFAQEATTPTVAEQPLELTCFERGPRHGRGLGPEALDAAAGALGISAEDLAAKLKDGMTLAEIAEEAGVEPQTVKDAIEAARAEALRAEIEDALSDGTITQEHADWLLEGLDKGFLNGRGFGFGLGKHGPPPAEALPES